MFFVKRKIWNPAQSFWGWLFIDFNWYGLLLMPFLGRIIKSIERRKLSNLFCMGFYFIAMYGLFSFCTVPLIRSVEFWLMIIVVYYITKKHVYIIKE